MTEGVSEAVSRPVPIITLRSAERRWRQCLAVGPGYQLLREIRDSLRTDPIDAVGA
jgi:hypothetical protein